MGFGLLIYFGYSQRHSRLAGPAVPVPDAGTGTKVDGGSPLERPASAPASAPWPEETIRVAADENPARRRSGHCREQHRRRQWIPLVFATLALGANLEMFAGSACGSGLTLAYFLVTTAIAAVIGLTLANALAQAKACRRLSLRNWLPPTSAKRSTRSRSAPPNRSASIPSSTSCSQSAEGSRRDGHQRCFILLRAHVRHCSHADCRRTRGATAAVFGGVGRRRDQAGRDHDAIRTLWRVRLIFVITSRFDWTLLAHLGLYVGAVLFGLAVFFQSLIRLP